MRVRVCVCVKTSGARKREMSDLLVYRVSLERLKYIRLLFINLSLIYLSPFYKPSGFLPLFFLKKMPGSKSQIAKAKKLVVKNYKQAHTISPIPYIILTNAQHMDYLDRLNRIEDPRQKRRLERDLNRIQLEVQKNHADTSQGRKNIHAFIEKNAELRAEVEEVFACKK